MQPSEVGILAPEETTVIRGELERLVNLEQDERVLHTNAAIKAAAARPTLF